jgi:trimethylamine--corrinoid protein Co-methyltransferase
MIAGREPHSRWTTTCSGGPDAVLPVGATPEDSRDSVELAAIAFGGLEEIRRSPVMLGIVNPISPLLYDERMAGSAMAYAHGGQPVIFMPFIFAGGTAPLGLAGAVAQMAAEVLAGLALVQLVNPGNPVVYGSSVSELNLHDGQPRYATAGHGLAMLASGQMARRYGLPFRAGGGFTGSPVPDVRAMQESLMVLWPALLSGPNFIPHAAGYRGSSPPRSRRWRRRGARGSSGSPR